VSRRIGALGAVAVLAVLALGISNASAASLTVIAGKLGAFTATHPCPGTATAVPATLWSGHARYRAVTLTLPLGCGDRPVQVTVTSGSTVLSGGPVNTNAGGQVTISFGTGNNSNGNTYPVTADLTIKATVSGWDLPTTDTTPAISCRITTINSTAICTATVTLGARGGNDFYHVVVTTPSTSWVSWEVTFNLAHPFYGSVPTRLGNADLDQYSDGAVSWAYNTANVNDVARSSLCSALPGELRVTGLNSGTSPNVFRDVKNDRTRIFDLLLNVASPSGYDDVISPGCT